jgi:hypothetical protein
MNPFKSMKPEARDKLVLDYITTAQPVALSTITARLYVPGLFDVPTERDIDGSLQRLRRAGKIRVYPKRGLWSLAEP